MTRLRADALLLLAAFIWGTAFIAQKYANESMTPVMFNARFLLSMLVVAPFAMREARNHASPVSRADWRLALLIGVLLFAGIAAQQIALVTASATNGGFLTAIYAVFAPLAAWLVQGVKPRPVIIAACAACTAGAWLLAAHGVGEEWSLGDFLLIVSDFIWAFYIALISKFLARTHRPFFLSAVQYGVTGILSIACGLAFEPVTWSGIHTALPAILYAGIISGGIGYTLQIVAQRYTPASEAALIMSLESVFAALSAAMLLHERLSPLGSFGCGLILAGVIMVEIGPMTRRVKNP